MNVNPVSQQPHFVKEILYSDQTSRVAVLAVGILSSAAILAVAQPPGSLVLASIILATTLAISLNEEDKETQSVVYVAKESSPTPVFFTHRSPWENTERTRARPQPFHTASEREPRVVNPPRSSERVPVGTEERNPFPQSSRKVPERPTERDLDSLSPVREPVGKRQRDEMHGRGNAVRL